MGEPKGKDVPIEKQGTQDDGGGTKPQVENKSEPLADGVGRITGRYQP